MFSKVVELIDSFQASTRVARALESGRKPKSNDLRKLGLSEDRIKSDFL